MHHFFFVSVMNIFVIIFSIKRWLLLLMKQWCNTTGEMKNNQNSDVYIFIFSFDDDNDGDVVVVVDDDDDEYNDEIPVFDIQWKFKAERSNWILFF